jgi:hypothetical protein
MISYWFSRISFSVMEYSLLRSVRLFLDFVFLVFRTTQTYIHSYFLFFYLPIVFSSASRFLLEPIFHVQNSILALLWFGVLYNHLKSSFIFFWSSDSSRHCHSIWPTLYIQKKKQFCKGKGYHTNKFMQLQMYRDIYSHNHTTMLNAWLICNRSGYLQWLVVGYK